jgi:AcrR family transcriptional regulator
LKPRCCWPILDGLEALSMLTLARRLECGVMTIYGYVDNKEDLLGVLDELPQVAGERQFEIGLTALADGLVNAATP